MSERTLRYAVVDLTNRTTDIHEIRTGCLDAVTLWHQELRFWWEADPAAVAFGTGPLTGIGAPGTGAMTWSYPKGGKLCHVVSEGRLGAMSRCAGVDAMVFCGKSEKTLCVTLEDGAIRLEEKSTAYESLLSGRKRESAVIAAVTSRGIVEDAYFAVSDAPAAKALAVKGVGAVVVETEGSFLVADSAAVLALSVELYQTAIRSGKLPQNQGRQHPARFLSLDHSVSFEDAVRYEAPEGTETDELLWALGMVWSQALPADRAKRYAARLLTACTGEPCAAEELDALSARLQSLKQETWEGGAV